MRTAAFRLRVMACLALALGLAGCGRPVELATGLKEPEANEIVGLLLQSEVTATKTPSKTGTTISVEGAEVEKAIAVLQLNGLPRERRSKLGDVFKKEGLVSSPLEERARYIYGLSQELEQTLLDIDGVVTARVHVVLPEKASIGESGTAASASVFLKHKKGFGVEGVGPAIRTLVANSVPGLVVDRVAVVLVPAMTAEMAASSPVPPRPEASPATGDKLKTGKFWWAGALGLLVVAVASWAAWRLVRRRQHPLEESPI